MIRSVKMDGFNFNHQTYAEFIQDYPLAGWQMDDLGQSSDESKKLYGFRLGDVKNKPVIYIQGTIHGSHEWFCAHWVKEFAKRLVNPSGENDYVQRVIEKLKADFGFYIIPCLNPWGYEYGDPNNEYHNGPGYGNKNGIPIHLNFGDSKWASRGQGDAPFDQPEANAVRLIWEELKPISMACCHTIGASSAVAYRPAKTHLINDVQNILRALPITLNEPVIRDQLWPLITVPTAYGWAAEQTNNYGVPVMSFALEVGQGYTNLNKSKYGMTGLLMYCMQQSDRMGFSEYGY